MPAERARDLLPGCCFPYPEQVSSGTEGEIMPKKELSIEQSFQ